MLGQENGAAVRGDDDSDDGSQPPPESRMGSSAEWAVQKAGESKKLSLRAVDIATDSRDTAKRIEGRQIAHERLFAITMGESPDPVRKIVGVGLLGSVAEILDELKTIRTAKSTEAATVSAVAQAKANGRAQWGFVGRFLVTFIGVAGTAFGLYKGLTGH